jgi:hypothetical protein
MIHKTLFRGLLALAVAGLIAGCTKDNSMTAPSPAANVSLGAEVMHQLAKVSHPGLEIDTAKILVRRIKFHQAGSEDPADVKSDSFVLRLVPGAPVSEVAVARIAPGSYDRLTFDIHKPEDLEIPPDPEFRDGSSGNQRYSVIIKGSYNDSSFVYRSRSEFTIEFELQTPLTVSDDGVARITFTVDPFACFGHHGLVFDPRNPSNAAAIEPAIKGAFLKAFRDDDRNGEPD